MGTHTPARTGAWRRWFAIAPVVAWCLLAAVVILCAWWWWSLANAPDSVGGADGTVTHGVAQVQSSPACGDGNETIVRLVDPAAGSTAADSTAGGSTAGRSTATLDGCGFAAGASVRVDYRAEAPQTVWQTGAMPAGHRSMLGTLVPMILAGVALVAVVAGGVVSYRRYRRSRRRRIEAPATVSAADLIARLGDRGKRRAHHPASRDSGAGEGMTHAGRDDTAPGWTVTRTGPIG